MIKMYNLKYIPEKHIERKTHELLLRYQKDRNIIIQEAVPIEDIIENHLKIHLQFGAIDKLTLAELDLEQGTVKVNTNLLNPDNDNFNEGRYNFTLAHEIGHWELHRHQIIPNPDQGQLFSTNSNMIICRKDEAKEFIEQQADIFASYLLMPTDLMYQTYYKLNIYDEDELIKVMAATLKVSKQAMRIRLNKLNLLSNNNNFQRERVV